LIYGDFEPLSECRGLGIDLQPREIWIRSSRRCELGRRGKNFRQRMIKPWGVRVAMAIEDVFVWIASNERAQLFDEVLVPGYRIPLIWFDEPLERICLRRNHHQF